jgi:hypothetical protein
VIFAVCAGFVLLRGLTRILIGVLIICGSAWIGFEVWQFAPSLAIEWLGSPVGWLTTGLPLLAFAATFLLLRKIARMIARPFGSGGPDDRPKRRLLKTALAVIPAGILYLTGGTLLHHAGSVSELRNFAEGGATGDTLLGSLKGAIHRSIPEAWLRTLDPTADSRRLSLAKLIVAPDNLPPALDPETGEPIPRAIIVDEAELKELARQGRFSTLLRHPRLTEALEDPAVREMLRHYGL